MSEYIITDRQLGLIQDFANVCVEGEKLPKIVRCRDCRAMRVKYGNTGIECWMNGEPFTVEPDGFCAWGVRRDA